MLEIRKLLNIMGVSGYETNIREYIIQSICKFTDEVEVDSIGNVIARIRGTGENKKKSVVISAHIDEIGIQVKSIRYDGKIKFRALGSLKVKNLIMRKIAFKNGVVGIVTCNADISNIGPRDVEALEIDCCFTNRSQAEKMITIGEVGTFHTEYFENKDFIISKAIDNRVGCWILLNLIKNLKKQKHDITFIFTVQEEVGFKGIKVAIKNIRPDIAIVVDTVSIENIEGLDLGDGVAIKISDSLTICNEELVERLKKLAKDYNINTQLEVTDNGGTELSVIDESHNGVKAVGLSIPIKYGHSANSIVNKNDILGCAKLLNRFIESTDTFL